ncbi:hypothetical protein GCM10023174_10420 [Chelativorans composti]|uniref:Uncharacterized protein n=1 Tax=Chelativorans composti TaxID=768533 RepID=A0ABW5DKN1_9HYPH
MMEDKATGSGRRMTDAELAEAKELYELGKANLVELSEKYGISRQALSRRLKDVGAVKNSRVGEVAAATAAAAKAAAVAAAERFADRRADWIEETRIDGVNSLKQIRLLTRKVVLDAMKAGRPVATAEDDLKALQRFNKIICDNLQSALSILRADEMVDQDSLPTLRIEDLTDEDILQHHKNTGALPEDATVADMLAENIDLEDITNGD